MTSLKDNLAKTKNRNAAYIDKKLTAIFNYLSKNPKPVTKAILHNRGRLELMLDGFNRPLDILTSFGGYAARDVGKFTTNHIEGNAAFIKYKTDLDEQGFDVQATWTTNANAAGLRFNRWAPLATLMDTNTQCAKFTLKITEKEEQQSVTLIEYKPDTSCEIGANLLQQVEDEKLNVKSKKPEITRHHIM